MSDDFATYIQTERERLRGKDRALAQQLAELHRQSAEIQKEFEAIEAYELAKTGKAEAAGTTRARRGSRREDIVNALRDAPDGMSRGDLLEHFGLKGDKSSEMSVSNALTAMMKAGQIGREGGRYHVPAQGLQAAAE